MVYFGNKLEMILAIGFVLAGIINPALALNTETALQNSQWAKEVVRRLDKDDQIFAEMRKLMASMTQQIDVDRETIDSMKQHIAAMKQRIQRVENENVILKEKLKVANQNITNLESLYNSLQQSGRIQYVATIFNHTDNATAQASAISGGQTVPLIHKILTTRNLDPDHLPYSSGGKQHGQPPVGTGPVANISPSTTPAFYTSLSQNINYPGEHHVIGFDDIFTNVGGHLNTHGTGVFTCGETGTYVFFWTVCVEEGTRLYADLIKNGARVGESLTGRGYEWNVGTGIAVLQLNPGDDLSVRLHDLENRVIIVGRLTFFSGFKLA